jgi:predicted DNA-binding transcriptional regulator YafY
MIITSSDLSFSALQNVNVSAYRVLYILLMLVRYRSLSSMGLNRHLSENPMIGRDYNNETLSKYINTLRIAGCDIPKANNHNDYNYELLKTPFPFKLSQEEMEIIDKLSSVLSRQADERLVKDYRDFLEYLEWSVDTLDLPKDETVQPTVFYELAYQRAVLNRYREYCDEGFHLRLHYRSDSTSIPQQFYVEPQEIIQKDDSIILLALNCVTQESIFLDVSRIEDVHQLPSKNKRTKAIINATFVLYGKFAKSYRLQSDETITYQNGKELHVKAKIKDTETFLNRLMGYGDSCQLFTPERLRIEIRIRINRLIQCLEQAIEK